ncbi:unnamed protein product [Diatraea saccharalis]|uniref:Lipase domain-containing protein n=1 Tax=Diatraea saccharalis TaxID=40085 RepID=A0A9N9WH23_9NEOP|nr:unnamed protein product [Diatraea saccharalis]
MPRPPNSYHYLFIALPTDPIIRKLDSDLRYQYAEDSDGKLHLVDLWMDVNDFSAVTRFNPDTQNVYHLFTRNNPTVSQPLLVGNSGLLANTNFNAQRRTVILVHGWMDSATSTFNNVLVPGELELHGMCNLHRHLEVEYDEVTHQENFFQEFLENNTTPELLDDITNSSERIQSFENIQEVITQENNIADPLMKTIKPPKITVLSDVRFNWTNISFYIPKQEKKKFTPNKFSKTFEEFLTDMGESSNTVKSLKETNKEHVEKKRIEEKENETFLAAEDVNVIVVDWSAGSGSINYAAAVANTVPSGISVASFINWLNSAAGTTPVMFHLVGFSLGAHQVGIIGRHLGGSIAYITGRPHLSLSIFERVRGLTRKTGLIKPVLFRAGVKSLGLRLKVAFQKSLKFIYKLSVGLDAAGPGWMTNDNRFREDDGVYTELIHTNAGVAGIINPLAQVSFYPNGGVNMPGCGFISDCSHARSYFYFAESIGGGTFTGRRCLTSAAAMAGSCLMPGTLQMGGLQPKMGSTGIFYLETNAEAPFARG